MRNISVFAMLFSVVAMADVDARFAKLRDQAEPLASLGPFVDKYVGSCPPALMGGRDCEKNVELYRKGMTGKKFYMIITESTSNVLSVSRINPREGTAIINVTPFFAAGESALTHGAPVKTDENGNPILNFIQIEAKIPDGWSPQMLQRQVQAQGLRLQVVFTPQGLWSLQKKGGGTIKGVKAKFDGVVVSVGRTGEVVGVWTGG